MDSETFMHELEASEAVLRGHFILSSGRRSETYLQCARLLMYPERASRCCDALSKLVKSRLPKPDVIISPAMGGVVVGYEMARHMNVPAMFCERVDGVFAIRRGFSIEPGSKVLVVEDVVTTGKSSREAIECIEKAGGEVIGEACLIDRSGGSPNIGVPLVSLMELDIPTYSPDDLPEHMQRIPAIKPGSRPGL